MNSQQLLFINFIIFLALVLFFIFGRSKARHSAKLDLRAGRPNEAGFALSDVKSENERVIEAKDVTRIAGPQSKQLQAKAIGFIYNGHEWEAHEVLGLPKGCSLQTATSHYQNLIKTSDPSTFEFYEAAFCAILKANHN